MKTKTNTKIKDIWGTRSLFEDFKKMFFLLFIITVPLIFFTNPKRTDDIQQEKIQKVYHKSEPMINYWKQFRDDFKNEKVMTKKESEFSNYQENYYYDENTHSANYKITQKPSNEIDLNNQEQSDDIESIDSQDFINDVEPKDSTNDSQDKINDVVPKKHILRVREKFNVDPELKMLEKTIEENQFTNRKRIRENRERAKVAKETNSNEIKNIQVNLHEYLNKTNANIILSKPFTSPTYSNLPITKFFVNIMKFVLREKEIWNYPINAISDNMKEGHCFSFEGQRGNITIDLKTSLLVKAISIEHPKTEHPSSTPKTFSVFSFSAQSIDQLFQYKDHGKEIASNVEFPKNNIGPKIYSFTPVETRFIQFRFLENHGDPHYTCIYRLNVYV